MTLREVIGRRVGDDWPLLLVFDQFEEIFTLCDDDAQRRAVAEALAEAARERPEGFRLILGMRTEYLGRAAALPGLGPLVGRPKVIRLPGPQAVREIVAEPATYHGYTFEGSRGDSDPVLLDRILADPLLTGQARLGPAAAGAEDPPAAPLPLLEFALERLWLKAVERGSYQFTHADYEVIGGLGGAIAQHAQAVYESLPADPGLGAQPQKVAEAIFCELIGSSRTRRPRLRTELEDQLEARFGDREAARRVVDHLVAERLLVVRSLPGGQDTAQVDLAHEVLIERWGLLRTWLAQDPEGRILWEELQEAASEWARGSPEIGIPARSPQTLPGPDIGARLLRLADATRLVLTPDQKAFVEALRADRRRRRIGRLTIAAIALAALAMTGLFAFASRQAARARASNAILVTGKGLMAEELGQTATALHHFAGAVKILDETGTGHRPNRIRLGARARMRPRLRAILEQPGFVLHAAFSPRGDRLAAASDDGTVQVWATADGRPVGPPLRHPVAVLRVAFDPEGDRVATASTDGIVRIWAVAQGRPIGGPPLAHARPVRDLAFSPDGRRLVTACDDGAARVWTLGSDAQPAVLGHLGPVLRARFHPADGRFVVTASEDRTAGLWQVDGADARLRETLGGHRGRVTDAAFSRADGRLVATASEDGTARVWAPFEQGPPREGPLTALSVLQGHRGPITAADFDPAGRARVVTASEDGTARLWDALTERLIATLQGHQGPIGAAAFSPAGDRIVTASEDYTAKVWDATSGRLIATLQGHGGRVTSASFSPPDGACIATASTDGTIRLWEADPRRDALRLEGHGRFVDRAEFSPDGRRVVTASSDDTARVWDSGTGRTLVALRGHEGSVNQAHFDPTGGRVVTASDDGTAVVWEAAAGKRLATLKGHGGPVVDAGFSPDGQRVVTASWDGTAHVWTVASGQSVALAGHGGPVHRASFDPDGRRVVTASWDGTAMAWEAATGKRLATFKDGDGHRGPLYDAAFSPDGRKVVTASEDGTAAIWEAASGTRLISSLAHEGVVHQAAFDADGERVVTASEDGAARIWDAASGRQLASLRHGGPVVWAAFDARMELVVTASADGTAAAWEAATGKRLVTLFGHAAPVRHAGFSPDGQRVVTASWDGTARVWDLAPLEGDAGALENWAEAFTGTRLGADEEARGLGPSQWQEACTKALAWRRGPTLRAPAPAVGGPPETPPAGVPARIEETIPIDDGAPPPPQSPGAAEDMGVPPPPIPSDSDAPPPPPSPEPAGAEPPASPPDSRARP